MFRKQLCNVSPNISKGVFIYMCRYDVINLMVSSIVGGSRVMSAQIIVKYAAIVGLYAHTVNMCSQSVSHMSVHTDTSIPAHRE